MGSHKKKRLGRLLKNLERGKHLVYLTNQERVQLDALIGRRRSFKSRSPRVFENRLCKSCKKVIPQPLHGNQKYCSGCKPVKPLPKCNECRSEYKRTAPRQKFYTVKCRELHGAKQQLLKHGVTEVVNV